MFNEVTLVGRLGTDPEIKRLQSGKVVANFRIAVSEKWRDKGTGERKEKTDWLPIVCWNENLTGIIEQYLRKGSQVLIKGKLQSREWEKNGEKRVAIEVVMQGFDCKLVMVGGKNDGGGSRRNGDDDAFARGAPDRAGSSSGYRGGSAGRNNDMDDDIPFAPEVR